MPSQYGPVAVNVNTGALEYASGSVDSTSIADGSIVDADVNASAAIAASKLSGVVTQALADAKGDLVAASAADTFARVAVGANDTILTADSAQAAGVKWGRSLTAANGYAHRNKSVAGNVDFNNTSFAAVQPGAANFDLLVNAITGDVLEVNLCAFTNDGATGLHLDFNTIVSAAPVNMIGGGEVGSWYVLATVFQPFGGTIQYVVQAGDVSAGTVRLRLYAKTDDAVARRIYAVSTIALVASVKNLG